MPVRNALPLFRRYVLPAGLYLVGYLLLRLLAPEHLLGAGALAPWNAAPVLGVALVYWRGLGWAALTLAAPLLAWALDAPPVSAAGPLAATLTEALTMSAAGWALRRVEFRAQLGRLRDVLTLLILALVGAAVMAGLEASLFAARAANDWGGPGAVAGPVFLSNAVALSSVLPAVLVFSSPRPWLSGRPRITVEGVLQVAALAVIGWEVFGRFVNADLHFFYLLFLPFAWIASRNGQGPVVLALAGCYGGLVASDWVVGHRPTAILDLEVRFLALAATSLMLGAATAERRATEARMQARQAELAHVLRLNVGWEMASALAHELNQPLSAAMNYCQAAVRLLRGEKPNTERAIWAMEQGIDRIEHLGNIVRGLRDFMKKGEMSMLRTDPGDVAAEALHLLEGEAAASGIQLRAEGFQGLPPVLADRTQIVQVLVNLVRNAIQAIVASGTEAGRIDIRARTTDGTVEVRVADNGPGLDGEVAARLFEPFVTTRSAGMGLGLAIVKSIVEAHGGRVWNRSTAEGTTFGFSLPIAPQEEADHDRA